MTAAARGSTPRSAGAVLSEPVFQGRLYLANLVLQASGRSWSLPSSDIGVMLEYLLRAAPVIAAYGGQYGPVQISVAPDPLELTRSLPAPRYSDADLQGWVNGLVDSVPLDASAAVLVVNPPGVTNTDAQERGGVGVLGYHGMARIPYGFVNALGTDYSLDDGNDSYAEALSHEVAELAVDPRADDRNPEVCDGCGTNCLGSRAYRSYFDASGNYLGSADQFPPPYAYAFFVSAIAQPASATACPAPGSACAYPPP